MRSERRNFDGLPLVYHLPDEDGNKITQSMGTDFNMQAAPLLESLDEMEGKDQALALPLLVGASLLASFAGLQASQQISTCLANSATETTTPVLDPASQAVVAQLGAVVPAVVTIGVCTLFSKAEIQRLFNEAEEDIDSRILINNKQGVATLLAAVFSSIAVVNPVLTRLVPP